MKNTIILLSFLIVIVSCSKTNNSNSDQRDINFNKTSDFYEELINSDAPNIASLNQFITEMPKGGDIHHHYTGSIYAETYLDWVKKEGWKIDSCTMKIITNSSIRTECKSLTVDELIKNDQLYRKLLERWSDKDYGNHDHTQPAPDENFFNTFGYFGDVSNEYMNLGLNILKERAIKENVSYIETMLTRVRIKSENYFESDKIKKINKLLRSTENQSEVDNILSKIDSVYLGSDSFLKKINSFTQKVAKHHEGIDTAGFKMRYQTYAVRVVPPLQVYTCLLTGYIAAHNSPLIVGVNIVAPENNNTALNDYTLHMRIFNYLNRKYPNVNKALHAGELTLGMVRPKNLLFHINEAVSIAKAQRIGHGVDLPYESESCKLLETLKNHSTVIEINLTSNQFILGVKGNEHPYLIYSKYNVPLVISTDDSGVSRNNLTNEYVLLASRYKPSYKKIKEYVYNSIQYSFLNDGDKKESIENLNQKFSVFEEKISSIYNDSE